MSLFHRDFGGQGKPPLVVLHGLLGSSRNWQMAGRDLAARYHVLAPDLPNHGRSPHAERTDFDFMMGEVLGWMDELGLERVSLMGHSMGGKLAMLLACRHPGRVEQLIIVDIAPKDYVATGHRNTLLAMSELRLDTLRNRAEAEMGLEARIPDWGTRKFLVTNLEAGEDGTWRWMVNLPVLASRFQDIEANPMIPSDRYDGPVLFIVGGRSRYFEVGDWALAEGHFPKAHLEIVLDSGHNLHMDSREAFVRLILAFQPES